MQPVITPLLNYRQRQCFVKLENRQPGGSYKIRGVSLFLDGLLRQTREVTVLSAGNMAKTLGLLAGPKGIKVSALVPDTIPAAKIEALAALKVETRRLPLRNLWEIVETSSLVKASCLLHPFDSGLLLEGYSGIADEILEQCPTVGQVVIPFGVGGFAVAVARRFRMRKPEVRIIAVETSSCTPLRFALQLRKPVNVPRGSSWVDAIGTPRILPRVLKQILEEKLIDEVRVVDPEIAFGEALAFFRDTNERIEGAAATALAAAAGLHENRIEFSPRQSRGTTVCVATGGNVDAALFG